MDRDEDLEGRTTLPSVPLAIAAAKRALPPNDDDAPESTRELMGREAS